MSKAIISFRNTDTAAQAGRLTDLLQRELGSSNIVEGTSSLVRLGDDYLEAIEAGVKKAETLIVLIGRNWAGDWLSNADDYDRIALETAIRERKRILPILVNDGKLPSELPEALGSLARRAPLPLRDDSFREDAAKIVEATGIPKATPINVGGTDIPDDFPDLKAVNPPPRPAPSTYQSFGEERRAYVFGEPEDRGRDKMKVKAGAGARFGAYLIDAILLAVLGFVVGFILGLVMPARTVSARSTLHTTASLLGLALQIGYYLYFMTAWNGQTPGKRAVKIRVVRLDGQPITAGTAFARNIFGYFISGIVIGLGFLWILFDEKGQGWHDKIAKTMVIRDE
jgi:uncharacterized RDD family membrane protein YckC